MRNKERGESIIFKFDRLDFFSHYSMSNLLTYGGQTDVRLSIKLEMGKWNVCHFVVR